MAVESKSMGLPRILAAVVTGNRPLVTGNRAFNGVGFLGFAVRDMADIAASAKVVAAVLAATLSCAWSSDHLFLSAASWPPTSPSCHLASFSRASVSANRRLLDQCNSLGRSHDRTMWLLVTK